ncbi:MAG TPA: HAD family hydrolase [Opitutales bacterium]|nr:HAD family hydrolase [Opitutales bacterium]
MPEPENNLRAREVIAVIWDFDKTLIPGFMQAPIFEYYGVDERHFWAEVRKLPEIYARRGVHASKETIYLNHLLSYVRNGPMRGLNNRRLRELGGRLQFFPGLPEFFDELRDAVQARAEFTRHEISLEHYIISTGLAEMIRGSVIAPKVEGIYGCEFVENPLPPHFSRQEEMALDGVDWEIAQVGVMVDNTIKTRFIFEINKGSNKNPAIDVNAVVRAEDRRVPIKNMIYIADGPSDIPVFSVVRRNGGQTYAVYDPANPAEFAQNDSLLQTGRIHAYGPADYRSTSSTAQWLHMHVRAIGERIVREREDAVAARTTRPPRHLHAPAPAVPAKAKQDELFG